MTYAWKLSDTGQIVQLQAKPAPGQETLPHVFDDEDLGVFEATYVGESECLDKATQPQK